MSAHPHTEARERLEAYAAALESAPRGPGGTVSALRQRAADLRTLLDTPTQEGVGRWLEEDFELTERAFREGIADGYLAGRTDPADDPLTLHDDAINEAWGESETRKALGVREDALLPAPKPQPAPGAPEGWREEIVKWAKDFRIDDYSRDQLLERLAALTSSSATGGEEDSFWVHVRRDVYDRWIDLAQSNRRLREGLEKIASADKESWQRRAARAALKDNGHG